MVATPHAINVTLYEKSTVIVTRDIVPVAGINNDSFVLLVNPSFPPKTVAELIAYAKANPGKINLASSGTGNLTHLCGELFRMMTGIEVVHVPYRGTPAAHSALLAGDVHAMFDAIGSAVPQIQAGALRALGVTANGRLRVLPDVPAISDVVPGFVVTGWLGIGAPKGTPADIVERLQSGDQCGARRSVDQGADGRPRQRADPRFDRRFQQAHRRRNREMGQGGQVRRHQGGLDRAFPRLFAVSLPVLGYSYRFRKWNGAGWSGWVVMTAIGKTGRASASET